jgi:PPK2 family polyphosphate:nucleotide phosphotransferase
MLDLGAFLVEPGSKVNLAKRDADSSAGIDKAEGEEILRESRRRLDELQYLLWAENQRAVLVVLQAMDTGGKDGAIRDVFEGVNPQGIRVTSFKAPSAEELDHDYLWRIHKAVPGRGEFGIFNRSHYESVLIERVRGLAPKDVWKERYEQINAFEKLLSDNGVKIVKFFLHISKDEQLARLKRRLEDPKRNWKFSAQDVEERKLWDKYMEAYEDLLERCSTAWAPWRVVPANKKWYRNAVISSVLSAEVKGMDLKLPRPKLDLRAVDLR